MISYGKGKYKGHPVKRGELLLSIRESGMINNEKGYNPVWEEDMQ